MGQSKEIFTEERVASFDEDEWKYLKGMEAEEQIGFCTQLENDIHGKYSLIQPGDSVTEWIIVNSVDTYATVATSNDVNDLISYLRIMQIYKFEIHIS